MARIPQPDQALMKMPSFKAMRSFVAAAKYRDFTRAAEALCCSPALSALWLSQLSEQVDWNVWFAFQSHDLQIPTAQSPHYCAV